MKYGCFIALFFIFVRILSEYCIFMRIVEGLSRNLSEEINFEADYQVIDTSGTVTASCFDWGKKIGRIKEL
jgi:hypothetical protein